MDPSDAPFGLPAALAVAFFYVVVLMRAGATYALGRGARAGAGRSRLRARLESPRFRRAERIVERWGAPVIALSFLTIGFQTLANLAAGVLRMPLRAYLPALAIGGFAWALVWGLVGVATVDAVLTLAERNPVEAVAFVMLLAGLLVGIEWVNWSRQRARDAAFSARTAAETSPAPDPRA